MIKNRWINKVIISDEEISKYESLAKAIEAHKADLSEADLSEADLRGANLSKADLWGADLSEANLWGKKIQKAPITICNLMWWVIITEHHMKIGCELHPHEEWKKFKVSRIEKMSRGAVTFWTKHKKALLALCDIQSEGREELTGESQKDGK